MYIYIMWPKTIILSMFFLSWNFLCRSFFILIDCINMRIFFTKKKFVLKESVVLKDIRLAFTFRMEINESIE